LKRGKVPFYCCAWSNVASARNAIKSGFRPAWVEHTVIEKEKALNWNANKHFSKTEEKISNEPGTDEARRARIYPIILSEYNPMWPKWFEEEKTKLEELIGMENIAKISHYGSTAVPGLTAKPTVDILLEIHPSTDIDKLIESLPSEYICLDKDNLTMPTPPPHIRFIKGYLNDGFAEQVFHIHVRYPRDWEELHFRDYLIAHPETAAEYAELKRKLLGEYKHNRDGYTEAKSEFIRSVFEKFK